VELRAAARREGWSPLEVLVQSAVFRATNLRGWFDTTPAGLPPATVPVVDYDADSYLGLLLARTEELGNIRRPAYKAWTAPAGVRFAEHLARTAIPTLLARAADATPALRQESDAERALLGLTRLVSLAKTPPRVPSFHALQVFRDLVMPPPAALNPDHPWFLHRLTDDDATVLGPGAAPSLESMGHGPESLRKVTDLLAIGIPQTCDAMGYGDWSALWPSWMPKHPRLTLSDVESLSCETRKVWNILNGGKVARPFKVST
jgi:hypothetical protein